MIVKWIKTCKNCQWPPGSAVGDSEYGCADLETCCYAERFAGSLSVLSLVQCYPTGAVFSRHCVGVIQHYQMSDGRTLIHRGRYLTELII